MGLGDPPGKNKQNMVTEEMWVQHRDVEGK